MKMLVFIVLTLFSSQAWCCDLPFDVFQNGPNVIVQLRVKQASGVALSKEETPFIEEYSADERLYWHLKTQYEPVCSDEPDIHNCISQCKDRPKEVVDAAKYRENGFYYTTPPKQRAELQQQALELEKKWSKYEYYKGY